MIHINKQVIVSQIWPDKQKKANLIKINFIVQHKVS